MTASSRSPRRVATLLLAAILAGLGGVVLFGATPALAASKCDALTKTVHRLVDDRRGVNLLSYNTAGFAGWEKAGYSDQGAVFKVGVKKSGLRGVHVLYDGRTTDRIYTTTPSEISKLKKMGYKDKAIGFYAYDKPGTCLQPVYRLLKGKIHRFAMSSADRSALKAQGWKQQMQVFWAAAPGAGAPSPTDAAFTIAVIPDTQNETMSGSDTRFVNRSNWLVKNRSALNLKFVTHSGDIVSWDTTEHVQYQRARSALSILGYNKIPYSLSPGNHDTGAVCTGGSACPGLDAHVTVRDTTSFNRYLNGGVADVKGYFESGKVDNTYSRFAAGGRSWLVLNLELWPRKEAISWAQQVVSSHPDDNVIIVTHSYLTAGGAIYRGTDYGSTSPQYLFDNLVSRYANIRLVFSGHTGQSAHRVDTGVKGNRIDSFLLAMHSNTTNPTRIVQIDPSNGLLKSWVYAPATSEDYPAYTYSVGGIDWVK